MEYIIIEKKDSDKYVILDERNQGMCCVSKYTLAQLRDDGHIVYGLHSKRGETVKVKDIEILTEQKKPRVNKKVYDVSPSKRSAATVERGLKVSKKKELLRVTKEERDTSGKVITKQMYALPYKDKYMSEIGLVSKSRYQNVSYVENPKDIRVLKNADSAQERYEKIEEKINALKAERYEALKIVGNISEDIAKAKGHLTTSEFLDEFKNNLSSEVKMEMEKRDYSVSVYNNHVIEIYRNKDIQKYFRESSFTYEEYDGCIMMDTDAEKSEEYQGYIKKYRKPLSVKSKPREWLSLGDKDWLSYNCEYNIKIESILTKEYAKKLAKDFCS